MIFKRRVDSLNKQNNYWGFRGIKGQMFFNVLVNCAVDEAKLAEQLKLALSDPKGFGGATERLEKLFRKTSYVVQIGKDFMEARRHLSWQA